MQHYDAEFLALLDRYLAGESSAVEAEQVRQWLAADSGNQAILNDVDRIRGVARNRPPATRVDAAWTRAVSELGLDAGMDSAHVSAPTIQPRAHRPAHTETSRRTWTWRAVAASLAVAAVAAIVVTTSRPPTTQPKAEAREFATARGQRLNVQLADGSKLTLGPASRVKVAEDFGASTRELTLVGEAEFSVQHDASKPFRVHTTNGTVEDLGTEFMIDAYPENKAMNVVVASGKVALNGTALTRGQLGQLDRSGLVTVASNVDLASWFGWTKGYLTFHDTPAVDAFIRLGRWYDLNFVLSDKSLNSLPLTASFRDESSSQVMKVLDLTLRMRHEVHGRTVTFYPVHAQ
ncbi:MAG TPA: FecR domain-containing protein [Gemmatimonadaceae bacterium]|jgi:transmembrane sensor|nr:FecR domain-containing protein [Gemmatimonadaceae bacterium]